MVNILSGIGNSISSIWAVEPKQISNSLEEQINDALAKEREKIRPSREDMDTFGWVTGDNNPIHRLPKRAKAFGFDDIPVMGAHMASYGEQFIESLVERMREYWGADIKIIGQENKFKAPLFPGERTLWQVNGFKTLDDKIKLNLTGSVKDKRVIVINSTLGKEYNSMPQIAGPVYSKTYLLEPEHLEEFYNSVGGTPSERVPNMLPASFVPATLLELLKDKTQTMEGANLSMNYQFISEAKTGRIQVDIFTPKRPSERKGNFIYKFRTLVSQDTKPIAYGEITSSTTKSIDFDI